MLPFLLCGCAPALMGVAAGSYLVYDKRNLNTIYKDTNITFQINQKIIATPALKKNAHIVVETQQGVVLLVGEIAAPAQRIIAEKLVLSMPGVKRIYNELVIARVVSFTQRANDTWITSKVRPQLLLKKRLKSGAIKIVTENSKVYLMGKISSEQGNLAASAARKVPGVKQVVKVFWS